MKKLLVMMAVMGLCFATAGSAVASWDCYVTPACPPPICVDKVLCKGKAAGKEKLCGPCAPTIKWSGRWMTIEKCPTPPVGTEIAIGTPPMAKKAKAMKAKGEKKEKKEKKDKK